VKAARVKQGSVVWNKRFKTWNFLWLQDGRRRSRVIGILRDYPTKESATRAAEALHQHAFDCPRGGSLSEPGEQDFLSRRMTVETSTGQRDDGLGPVARILIKP
jgi:hypothetical protein